MDKATMDRLFLVVHEALGGYGWAYSNYGGDEYVTQRADLERVVEALRDEFTRATPEPVAPAVSPDIAGLVDRCTRMLARARETIGNDTQVGLQYRLGEALDALQRVAQERDDYAVIIAGSERLTAVQNSIINSVWDILGRDETRKGGQNLIGRVKELSERAEAAEARLSSARE